MKFWLRSPILHFVVIGAALFGVRALRAPSPPDRGRVERAPIVISAERIREMRSAFVRRWGVPATPEQLNALIEQAVEEELLYREARVLALDFQDRSVQRRLLEKMRVVGDRPGRSQDELLKEAHALGLDEDVVIRRLLIEKMRLVLAQEANEAPLTERDFAEYLERHGDRFEQPAQVTFSHVFLSGSRRGARLASDAQTMLRRLRSLSTGPDGSVELSDPFPLGLQLRAWSENRLIARFGKPFAKEVSSLEPGAWSAPIASPYGLHLVWVENKTAARIPELAAVRKQVAEGLLAERGAAGVTRGLVRLRGLYDVRIDGRTDVTGSGRRGAVRLTALP